MDPKFTLPKMIYNSYTNATRTIELHKNKEHNRVQKVTTQRNAKYCKGDKNNKNKNKNRKIMEIAKMSIGMGWTYLVPDRHRLELPHLYSGNKTNTSNTLL